MAIVLKIVSAGKRGAGPAVLRQARRRTALFALAVGLGSGNGCDRVLHRVLSAERTLYRCEACLPDGTRCASYSDDCEHDIRWSGSEEAARREAQIALCVQVEKELPVDVRGACAARPSSELRFTCASWRGRCSAASR